jgi:hypothetical protein
MMLLATDKQKYLLGTDLEHKADSEVEEVKMLYYMWNPPPVTQTSQFQTSIQYCHGLLPSLWNKTCAHQKSSNSSNTGR